MADAATFLPGEKEQKVPCRYYSAVFVLTSLLLVLSDGLSLRGARAAFIRCYSWLQRKMPSHTVIRDWIMQVGYYKLMKIQKSKDWIGMIDLSIQVGSKKCLLILGVQAATLLKKQPLTYEDVHVLHMELLEKSSGPIIYDILKKSEEKVGQYKQFCHDQGSDIVSATRLYAEEILAREGRKIYIINDIAHKIANFLSVETEELKWDEFARKAARMKQKLQLTKLAAFCPPSQRSKARYMNLDELVAWGRKILSHIDKMTSQQQQANAKNLCEKKGKAALRELQDKLGWVQHYKPMLQEVSELLLIGKITRHKIRAEGLHRQTAEELDKELQNLPLGERACQFAGKIIDFVTEQTRGLEELALGSTEIIESSFGKLKRLMDEDSKDGFTPFILSLSACLGKLDLETIKSALYTCSKKDIKAWSAINIGETVYSQRRRLFNPFKKREKKKGLFDQFDGGPDHTGIFTEQVVNL